MRNRDKVYLFDEFILDLARDCVVRAGQSIHLRPQSYQVLKCLVENRGRLISKNKLIEEVWHGRAVTDASLAKCIEEVREALGSGARQYVRNVHGRGYIFDTGIGEWKVTEPISRRSEQIDVVRVLVHEEEIDEPSIAPSNMSTAITAARAGAQPKSIALIITAIFIALAATAFAIYWVVNHPQSRDNVLTGVPFRDMDISRLTTSGKITHAAISPDGKYVANVVKDVDGNSVWVRNFVAPRNARVAGPAVSEFISVTFAPDGHSVNYIALDHDKGESTLFRVPTLGGPSDIVANDIYPIAFSPDGKQIAFIRFRQSESHLVVAEADGSNQRDVATRHKPDSFGLEWNAPAWSPDGKKIAVPARLNDQRGHYATIISVNLTDGTQSPPSSTRWNYVGQPVWLADGSGLLLPASEAPGSPMQICHISLQNGVTTRITHDLNNYSDLSLTTDASRLAAVQVQEVSHIGVAPEADAGRTKQIRSEIGSLEVLAWTSDGQIVYRSSAGGSGADIWIMKADGSNARQLTVGARASRGLAVTRNGRHIIFSSDRAGQFNLWRVDRDAGNLRQLTAGDGEFYPQCTPDGQWIVYQSNEAIDPRLWKVPTEGGQPVQLTTTRATKPAVSPDSQMIAYSYLDIDLTPSRWGIGIISSEGGQRLNRFDFLPTVVYRAVRWSPDGQSIAFVNNAGGLSDIWLQPLNGSPPRQLTNFKAEQILAFDWSPDGHSLAFVSNVQTSDVVLIEREQK
ncbi:MAG: DPP IV N-terminal domain-containing protein [Pyrinomonadaceae bacterium]